MSGQNQAGVESVSKSVPRSSLQFWCVTRVCEQLSLSVSSLLSVIMSLGSVPEPLRAFSVAALHHQLTEMNCTVKQISLTCNKEPEWTVLIYNVFVFCPPEMCMLCVYGMIKDLQKSTRPSKRTS